MYLQDIFFLDFILVTSQHTHINKDKKKNILNFFFFLLLNQIFFSVNFTYLTSITKYISFPVQQFYVVIVWFLCATNYKMFINNFKENWDKKFFINVTELSRPKFLNLNFWR